MAYTTINKGSDYFNTKLWTGNDGTQSITGVGFQPDLVWTKSRNTDYAHSLFDVVRGTTKRLSSGEADAESTISGLTSFDSDGFTLGSNANCNQSTITYVGWNWLGGGTASSNTNGDITSSVSANTTSGFSIVSYTGNGSAGATIGHSLGVKPSLMIFKDRDNVRDWIVYHKDLGATKFIKLNLTDASGTSSLYFNNTEPTSSLFTVGSGTSVNNSGTDYIAYCFADVKGYSKFGSFNGNASADGTFVYTGFKPAFVITKLSSGIGSWFLHDNKRNGYNGGNNYVYANASDAELTTQLLDITSNGFKMRFAGGANSSGTSIYMAFAENPFVSSTGTPVTAR